MEQQREQVLSSFMKAKLKCTTTIDFHQAKPSNSVSVLLDVDVKDSGISVIPVITLEGIWPKAKKLS